MLRSLALDEAKAFPFACVKEVAAKSPAYLRDANIDDLDVFLWSFFVRLSVLDFMNNIQALNGTTKDCMLFIEPRL